MYYPILRGKQYELLALRACADLLPTAAITPVIEPVRDLAPGSGSVWRCLTQLAEAHAPACVIVNPTVGDYQDDLVATTALDLLEDVDPKGRIALGIRVERDLDASRLHEAIGARTSRPHIYVHAPEAGDSFALTDLARQSSAITHIAQERSRVRRHASFRDDSRVVKFEDRFKRAPRNSDYRDCEPYQFTDWNMFYQEDGYVGYSDYATIGEEYVEGGFTPRAVAIHLTYRNPDDSTIWIQHFVSQDGTDSTANVKGKFSEAVGKLVAFANDQSLDNPAINEFRRLHSTEQFPGLGVIKKLSLINHLHVAATTDA